LQQNALEDVDSYASIKKQIRMLELILHFHERAVPILSKGCPIYVIHCLPVVNDLVRMKTSIPNDQVDQRISELRGDLDQQMDQVMKDYA
jgi:V/A-type H+-transporting ATPase subunit A